MKTIEGTLKNGSEIYGDIVKSDKNGFLIDDTISGEIIYIYLNEIKNYSQT